MPGCPARRLACGTTATSDLASVETGVPLVVLASEFQRRPHLPRSIVTNEQSESQIVTLGDVGENRGRHILG